MWATEDVLEIEFKFVPDRPEHETVAALAEVFGPDYVFVKWPPVANLDIYLDTPGLDLHEANTPLRLRVWGTPFRHKELVSANFKYLPVLRAGLRRRELKTLLPHAQARAVCRGEVIGTAVEHAEAVARERAGAGARFGPRLMISCFQSVYILRPRAAARPLTARPLTAEPPGAGAGPFAVTRGRASDLVLLSFEQCTVREMDAATADRMMRNGMLDYDPALPSAEFAEAELEIIAPEAGLQSAEELYLRAHQAVTASGVCAARSTSRPGTGRRR